MVPSAFGGDNPNCSLGQLQFVFPFCKKRVAIRKYTIWEQKILLVAGEACNPQLPAGAATAISQENLPEIPELTAAVQEIVSSCQKVTESRGSPKYFESSGK